MNAFAVVSDGTLPEESSFFLRSERTSLRFASEPPQNVQRLSIRDASCLPELMKNHYCKRLILRLSLTKTAFCQNAVPDYTDENVSTKVVKIIQSYTGVVDKMVWRKL